MQNNSAIALAKLLERFAQTFGQAHLEAMEYATGSECCAGCGSPSVGYSMEAWVAVGEHEVYIYQAQVNLCKSCSDDLACCGVKFDNIEEQECT